jgi:hypothetical protein
MRKQSRGLKAHGARPRRKRAPRLRTVVESTFPTSLSDETRRYPTSTISLGMLQKLRLRTAVASSVDLSAA